MHWPTILRFKEITFDGLTRLHLFSEIESVLNHCQPARQEASLKRRKTEGEKREKVFLVSCGHIQNANQADVYSSVGGSAFHICYISSLGFVMGNAGGVIQCAGLFICSSDICSAVVKGDGELTPAGVIECFEISQ